MKSRIWKAELILVAAILCLAEAGFVRSWAVTGERVLAIAVLIGLAAALPYAASYLEKLPNSIFWMGIFGIFTATRVGWLAAVPTVQVSDFHFYFTAACDIANGRGITDPLLSLFPNWWGYPLVLGAVFRIFGCREVVGQLFTIVLAVATLPPLYFTAKRLGGSACGRCAVMLFVLWPAQLMFSSVLATEHLALPLAVAGFLFGVKVLQDGDSGRIRNAVFCGALLAWGASVRPAIAMVLAAVGLTLLLRVRPWKQALRGGAALAVAYLSVSGVYGVVFRHFNHGQTPTPSFATAANLLYGSNYEASGMWNEGDFATIKSWQKDQALNEAIQITRRRVSSYGLGQLVSLCARKITEFWALPYYGYLFSTHTLSAAPKVASLKGFAAEQSAYIFQLFLVIACVFTVIRRMRSDAAAGIEATAIVILLGSALHIVFVVSSRYSYQYTPMLLVFAASGVAGLGSKWMTQRSTRPGGRLNQEDGEERATNQPVSVQRHSRAENAQTTRLQATAAAAISDQVAIPFQPLPAFESFVGGLEEADCRGKRIGILIVAYNAITTLSGVLRRIPPSVWQNVEEVVVFDDASSDATFELAVGIQSVLSVPKLRALRHPSNLGYGGNQKAGYQYFIDKGFDICVLLHGDGQYAPELLARMYSPLVKGDADAVFGSRMMPDHGGPLKGGMPLYKYVGNRILSEYENRALGLTLTEFHSGYRAYDLKALGEIEFSRMTDDFHFDTEIIIKLRHQGFRIKEVPIPTYYGTEICYVNGIKYAANVYRAVQRYRRTVLSVECHPEFAEYFVRYPIKRSRYSSHDYAIRLVGKDKDVLDIGCGEGLLACDLAKNGNRVTGVDTLERPKRVSHMERYVRADMEQGVPQAVTGERFDVILLLDVLEHLRNPVGLLDDCKRLLRPGGRLIISVPNFVNITVRLMVMCGIFTYRNRGILDTTHVRFYTRRTVRDLLEQCKLRSAQEIVTVMPVELVLGLSPENALMRLLTSALALATRISPGLLGYQIMHVAACDQDEIRHDPALTCRRAGEPE